MLEWVQRWRRSTGRSWYGMLRTASYRYRTVGLNEWSRWYYNSIFERKQTQQTASKILSCHPQSQLTSFKSATTPNHQPFDLPSRWTSTEDPLLRHRASHCQGISILISINLVPLLSLCPVDLMNWQSKTHLLLLNLGNLLFHLDSCLKTLMILILGVSWLCGTRQRN